MFPDIEHDPQTVKWIDVGNWRDMKRTADQMIRQQPRESWGSKYGNTCIHGEIVVDFNYKVSSSYQSLCTSIDKR